MKERAQNIVYTPSTQMNKYLIWETQYGKKTSGKVRPMLYSLFISYKNEHTKEWELTMELAFDTVAWMTATKSSSSSAILTKYNSQMFFSVMEQDTMQNNRTLSPPSGSIFNIAR